MSDLNDILDRIPIDDIAEQLGVSKEDAATAVAQAVPTLLAGMQANAASGGEASLEKALKKHESSQATAKKVADIDTADGEKIVKNVLGDKSNAVAEKVAEANPSDFVSKDLIAKVLPIVAPIVIGFLASKFFGGSSTTSTVATKSEDSGGGLGDLVGNVLGGLTGSSTSSSSASGGIGDLIGGLLGGLTGSSGKSSSNTSDGLGGLLGGLLGGSGGIDLGGMLGGLGGLLGGGKK